MVWQEGVVGFSDTEDVDTPKKKKKPSLAKKSGGFQNMGLSFPLLKAIQKRGYKVPTPIQRKTIPLVLEGRDVVAMARTGSGKTACFLVPLLEKLRNKSNQSSIKALILCPTRELALQTLKFVKEIGRYTGVKHCSVIGGDSMETQFSSLHANPDIVVATTGRFLHVCVEMQLKLNSVQTLVLDEADRLFEMGLGEELKEILARIPEDRQTLLFSATLPKALVEFARAGLSDPVLIRLDVEHKLPETLDVSFVLCRAQEKASTLLALLRNVVPRYKSTIVFAASKHHVEYIHSLLGHAGIKSTFIYSDLDASARKINAAKFQTRQCRVLVVTDLAARGIDIPCIDYVINYNFPAKPKLFVHRVGRCARAGRKGWAISLVAKDETCYMLDIHLFLSRPLALVPTGTVASDTNLLGSAPRRLIEDQADEIINWETTSSDLVSTRTTSENAYKHYLKCRPGASRESVRRSKQLDSASPGIHALFSNYSASNPGDNVTTEDAQAAANLVASIQSYRPPGTIFEIGQSSRSELYTVMKRKRETHKDRILSHKQKQAQLQPVLSKSGDEMKETVQEKPDAEEIGRTFSKILGSKRFNRTEPSENTDRENFIPYRPLDHHTEQGLAVNNFQRDSSAVGLDLAADTESGLKSAKAQMVWDKKKKKMVGVQDKCKKIRSESGAWINASYRSGRYQQWMEKTKAMEQMQRSESDEENTPSGGNNDSRLDTHWRRHNVKEKEKKNLGLKTPQQIVRQRLEKEKRQRRNGPNKKKKHRK